jgi:hypothetical protein
MRKGPRDNGPMAAGGHGGVGPERRLLGGAATAHLLGRGGGVLGVRWLGGAGDAAWGGRGAPARSAPVRRSGRWNHGLQCGARTGVRRELCAARPADKGYAEGRPPRRVEG